MSDGYYLIEFKNSHHRACVRTVIDSIDISRDFFVKHVKGGDARYSTVHQYEERLFLIVSDYL